MTTPLQTRFDKFKTSGLLPSPKGAAMAVVALSRKEDVSTQDLAHAIQADPALGFSLMSNHHSGRCQAFNYPAFWSRNLARAVAMQELSGVMGVVPGDEAFSLGLLSQVGELGLGSRFCVALPLAQKESKQ